jgi:hypothetical protein
MRRTMSDVEHEMIVDHIELQERLARLSVIAIRSLAAASEAQDIAFGKHDEWLDEAKLAVVGLPIAVS